jgi:intein-encoded DNA endonuclease-like protein
VLQLVRPVFMQEFPNRIISIGSKNMSGFLRECRDLKTSLTYSQKKLSLKLLTLKILMFQQNML